MQKMDRHTIKIIGNDKQDGTGHATKEDIA